MTEKRTMDELFEAILAKLEEINGLLHSPSEVDDDDREVDDSTDNKPPASSALPHDAVVDDSLEVDICTNSESAPPISSSSASSASPSFTSSGMNSDVASVISDDLDVTATTPVAAMTVSMVALTRCSTPGLYQAAGVPTTATALSPSSSPSSTSTPSLKGDLGKLESPNHDVRDPVLVAVLKVFAQQAGDRTDSHSSAAFTCSESGFEHSVNNSHQSICQELEILSCRLHC